MADYLVQEADGVSKFTLEDGSGAVLLEFVPGSFDAASFGMTSLNLLGVGH